MANHNLEDGIPIRFPGLLAIVFITLKLLGNIDWPWVGVLSPIWITMTVVFTLSFTENLVARHLSSNR